MSLPSHIRDAIEEYVPPLQGWTSPERACEMADCIIKTQAQVCIDIGVFAGRSTLAMGFAARELGNSMVYGIDAWRTDWTIEGETNVENLRWWQEDSKLEEMHRQTMEQIWAHRLEEWVTIIRAPSQYVHQLFPEIGFLNIDGNHTEVASCRDIELYLPKLRKEHYLMMDDCDWQSTQKAISMIEEQCHLVKTMKDTSEARLYRKC